MNIFSTDIPSDRNMYEDNIATKRDDHAIIPETIHEINVLWGDVLFCYLHNSKEAYSEPSLKHYNKVFFSNS